eukprot:6188126-Pleurochrysis_carterae.AAC.10
MGRGRARAREGWGREGRGGREWRKEQRGGRSRGGGARKSAGWPAWPACKRGPSGSRRARLHERRREARVRRIWGKGGTVLRACILLRHIRALEVEKRKVEEGARCRTSESLRMAVSGVGAASGVASWIGGGSGNEWGLGGQGRQGVAFKGGREGFKGMHAGVHLPRREEPGRKRALSGAVE